MQTPGVSRYPEIVAEFWDAWPSGIAVSRSGRMFLSFPRVEEPPAPVTLGELRDGKVVAFPDGLQFTSVHGLRMGPANRLFALDSGARSFEACEPEAAALYLIDLDRNAVARRYAFARDVVLPTTYLNDLVVEYGRGAAGTAYITDSGSKGPGGIVVVDLESGRSWRRLAGHPSVRGRTPSAGFGIRAEGETLTGPDPTGADGIALSPDGTTLWWTPLSSYDLYCISTDVLADTTKSDEEVARAVVQLPARDFASDGLDCDREGRVYFTDVTNNALQRFVPAEGRFEMLFADDRLVWPDGVSLGPDRIVYVTSSQLNRSPNYQDGQDRREKPYRLFRAAIDADPAGY